MKYLNLDNVKDLRKNIGFHFTNRDKSTINKILKEGIVPKMGANSSNSESKEAIDKVFFSYGMQGTIKLFNTFINLYRTANIGFFEADEHRKCIPNSALNKRKDDRLSTLEAFEATRQYMDDKVYLVFKAEPTIYQRDITDEQLEKINEDINNSSEKNRISEIDDQIYNIKNNEMLNEKEKEEKINSLSNERRKLTLDIREKSKVDVDNARGKLIDNKDGIFDVVDYNEVKMRWENNIESASNVHIKIIEKDGYLTSEKIKPDGVVSKDNKNMENAVDVISELYSHATPEDNLVAGKERFLVDKFLEYNQMVEKYKKEGLLIQRNKKDKTLVMDLKNIDKYDGLKEFSENIIPKKEKSFISNLKDNVKNENELSDEELQSRIDDSKNKEINKQDIEKEKNKNFNKTK